MAKVRIVINGTKHARDVERPHAARRFLRDGLGLAEYAVGCDTTQCGCCTVHINGRAVKSCTVLAAQANSADVRDDRGMAKDGKLHPIQQRVLGMPRPAMRLLPGMIMATAGLLKDNRIRPRTRSSTGWKATSAAAPATSTS